MATATARRATGIPPFQRFLEENRTPVYRFLLAAAGPQDADDCFQETFLAALRAYPKLRDAENLRGWVLAIAGRKAIDAARSRARRPVPMADVPDRPGTVDGVYQLPFDPVWEAVRDLPVRQRVALIQRVVLDRPYADVALGMGGSEETARANVYQALKKLRNEVTRS
jgi:RNA polymerase sigma factor (sigma-70 family)